MPSSPNYVRDIAQEKRTAKRRGDDKRDNLRKKARRLLVKKGLVKPNDGKDVDHKVALKKGGSPLDMDNLRVTSASDNRSFPRNKDGSMKRNT
jgi:hypothetical protein